MPCISGLANAFQQPARQLAKEATIHYHASLTNTTPYDRFLTDLTTVSWSCRKENWDGYGASPIPQNCVEAAAKFFSSLSATTPVPTPEVTPEADGEVALEWYGVNGSVFSISFGSHNLINYAGLFSGNNKVHGVENFDSIDPKIISSHIKKALSA